MKFSSTFVIISSSTLAAAFAPIGGEILYMIDLFFAVLMHYLEEEAAGGGAWGESFLQHMGFVGVFVVFGNAQIMGNGQWILITSKGGTLTPAVAVHHRPREMYSMPR